MKKAPGLMHWDTGGFTLLEVVFAVGIIAVGFLGSFALVLQAGKQVSAAEENALVCSGLEQEIDLLRTLSWPTLTDGTGITGTVWAAQPQSVAGLTVTQQTITISAYDVAGTQTLNATWNTGSPATVSFTPAGSPALSTATAVKVVATLTWTGRRSTRPTTRTLVTIISAGGISSSDHP